MPVRRIRLIMPCSATQAFETFHNHDIRTRWDSLLSSAVVEDGSSHPYVGAISSNQGRGWKRLFAMRTRFVNYRPSHHVAAAVLIEPQGCFQEWAASMHHKDLGDNTSELTYTFNLRLRPRWLGWMFDSLINRLFEIETRRRFAAMAKYLAGEHGQMPSNQDGTMNQ
ncbi:MULTISPECIES: hypothetical protein [Pseudomonas syringae group]|uniref:hypothetical protein n=1 Tax=Pseudomonas syringae group TaxID=136849 RepID=UPI00020962F2|nr:MULTISPECIES: hypothetical protein [Pseudomonas syringae group]EGH95136.1 hypothetical protein PLA106_04007 [Pseudomonas amygdali pv. lachrymans str. M302278]KPW28844.1 Uncharacterized protein ALO87_03564 [Pseudomonas syringae pv. apii]KPX67765.1 Uncharacterized protein ALO84_00902 [Pseudomonas syringae pv. maculicola]MBM0211481.1 hypothetical protein [Pseudomonas syringae pv. maculicola]RMM07983.1 hypothetical protein ALQ85_200043 [Pseudomonas syringae]